MKIGDKVLSLTDNGRTDDLVGTIIDIREDLVSVEFRKNINGHDGMNKKGRRGYCWNIDMSQLKLIKINNDETTRIRWYKNGKLS